MAGFVQIMEFDTSRIEELEAFSKKMQEERGDALLASRATIGPTGTDRATTTSSSSSSPTRWR